MAHRHREDPWNAPVGRDYAWAALAVAAGVLAAAGASDAVWQLVAHHSALHLVGLPVAGLFYWWVGAGAWRRTVWGRNRSVVGR